MFHRSFTMPPPSYKPSDFSDVGQAEVLAKYFSGELRYSPATHFIRYSDHFWQETEPGAQAVAHELTRRQLKEAKGPAGILADSQGLRRTGYSGQCLESQSRTADERGADGSLSGISGCQGLSSLRN